MMFSIFVVEDNDAIIGSLTLRSLICFHLTVCLAVATSIYFLPLRKHLKKNQKNPTHNNLDLHVNEKCNI